MFFFSHSTHFITTDLRHLKVKQELPRMPIKGSLLTPNSPTRPLHSVVFARPGDHRVTGVFHRLDRAPSQAPWHRRCRRRRVDRLDRHVGTGLRGWGVGTPRGRRAGWNRRGGGGPDRRAVCGAVWGIVPSSPAGHTGQIYLSEAFTTRCPDVLLTGSAKQTSGAMCHGGLMGSWAGELEVSKSLGWLLAVQKPCFGRGSVFHLFRRSPYISRKQSLTSISMRSPRYSCSYNKLLGGQIGWHMYQFEDL